MLICMECGNLHEEEEAQSDTSNRCCEKRMVSFGTAWHFVKLALRDVDLLKKRVQELEQHGH